MESIMVCSAASTIPLTKLSFTVSGAGKGKKVALISDSRATTPPTADQFAAELARDGWEVTLFDLSPFRHPSTENTGDITYKVERLCGKYNARHWYGPMQALVTYHALKEASYDLIMLHNGFDAGFFACTAKKLGLAFQETPIVVFSDWPYSRWLEHLKLLLKALRTDAEIEFMERETLAMADAVMATDSEAIDWINSEDIKAISAGLLSQEKSGKSWGQWLSGISNRKRPPSISSNRKGPLLSVCFIAKTPELANNLVSALEGQTNNDLEAILLDNLPEEPSANKVRKELRERFAKHNWAWLDGETADNQVTPQNNMAKIAKGEYLLFLDEDDIPTADIVDVLKQIAKHNDAPVISTLPGWNIKNDILFISVAKLPGRKDSGQDNFLIAHVPYGDTLSVNLFANVMGDCTFYKRQTFSDLGGFSVDDGLFHNWGLMLRATLAEIPVILIPEVLVLNSHDKTFSAASRERTFKSRKAILDIIAAAVPRKLRSAIYTLAATMDGAERAFRFPTQEYTTKAQLPCKTPSMWAKTPDLAETPTIVLCSNDHFTRPLAVSIASIWTHTPKAEIIVLSSLSKKNANGLQSLAGHFNRKLTIIPMTDELTKGLPVTSFYGQGLTSAIYWRLLLPELLPSTNRVIYLDSDILCRQDITALWKTSLMGKTIGAVPDGIVLNFSHLMNHFNGDYFNTGVMLIDLEQWRKKDISRKTLDWFYKLEEMHEHLKLGDQTAINNAIDGDWLPLSPTWNYSPLTLTPDKAQRFKLDRMQINEIAQNPAIVHFLGLPKPWNETGPNNNNLISEYRTLLKLIDTLAGFNV